jgi:hypothetical protein
LIRLIDQPVASWMVKITWAPIGNTPLRYRLRLDGGICKNLESAASFFNL